MTESIPCRDLFHLLNRLEAEAAGGPPVCLAVVRRSGVLAALVSLDGTPERAVSLAQRKAYTALSTKTPTRLFAERARNNPEAANLNSLPELLLLGGGEPLFADAELVGALGIAGAGGAAQDEACAVLAAEQLGLKITP